MITRLLGGMLIFFAWVGSLQAEIPGTARSNDRDILRLDVSGGLSSPAPGVAFGGSVLWTMRPAHTIGLSTNYAYHRLVGPEASLSTQSLDVVWEYSLALFEGFHGLRLRPGLGAARVHRSWESSEDQLNQGDPNPNLWGGHGLVSLSFDLPMADLMWLRVGARAEKVLLSGIPAQTTLFAGWVFGGQWIGIGD